MRKGYQTPSYIFLSPRRQASWSGTPHSRNAQDHKEDSSKVPKPRVFRQRLCRRIGAGRSWDGSLGWSRGLGWGWSGNHGCSRRGRSSGRGGGGDRNWSVGRSWGSDRSLGGGRRFFAFNGIGFYRGIGAGSRGADSRCFVSLPGCLASHEHCRGDEHDWNYVAHDLAIYVKRCLPTLPFHGPRNQTCESWSSVFDRLPVARRAPNLRCSDRICRIVQDSGGSNPVHPAGKENIWPASRVRQAEEQVARGCSDGDAVRAVGVVDHAAIINPGRRGQVAIGLQ